MKKSKIPSLVILLIQIIITITFWIAFSVARIFMAKPETSVPKEILTPVSPSLDKNTLDKINQRLYFDREQGFEPQ